jgi:hypothetical protein
MAIAFAKALPESKLENATMPLIAELTMLAAWEYRNASQKVLDTPPLSNLIFD